MKIIFIDCDGVLSTDKEVNSEKRYNDVKPEYYGFKKECVEQLNRIVEETGAKLVASTSWRLHWNFNDLKTIFKTLGVKTPLIDKTDEVSLGGYRSKDGNMYRQIDKERVVEIRNWVKENEKDIESWCAIDDFPMFGLMPNIVITNEKDGLTQKDADKVIAILNKKNQK
jgi:protein associated with RNAse G/E